MAIFCLITTPTKQHSLKTRANVQIKWCSVLPWAFWFPVEPFSERLDHPQFQEIFWWPHTVQTLDVGTALLAHSFLLRPPILCRIFPFYINSFLWILRDFLISEFKLFTGCIFLHVRCVLKLKKSAADKRAGFRSRSLQRTNIRRNRKPEDRCKHFISWHFPVIYDSCGDFVLNRCKYCGWHNSFYMPIKCHVFTARTSDYTILYINLWKRARTNI